MTKIKLNLKVQSFISDLADTDPLKHEIVMHLYSLFLDTSTNFHDKFIYGGIGVYIGDQLIGGIWVSKNHVSLVFADGHKLKDSANVLEGKGKYRRHIKIKSFEEIEEKCCQKYIRALFNLQI